jgi:hypothetical protein
MIDEVNEVTVAIRHWGNIEYLYLRSDANTSHNRYESIEENLIELYEKIFDFKVDLSIACQQKTSGEQLFTI